MSEKKLANAAHSDRICLNYTDFLSASCRKRWSFVDAIYGVMPIFGMVTKKPTAVAPASPERLKELALQIISTQVSDEINIARLIALAQQQQIAQFDILLPYPLSDAQLACVREEVARPLELQQLDDCLRVTIGPQTH